ncbi:MAG: 8-oxo-dGTP diphosphatase [Lachnospiraceae bacterium]|nr:8-oxo-dGTP diphosphatase [Lachnospiraceae bacterium]
MIRSTLCYIERDGCYLMLYRNKKKNDPNAGKWVGIGGKFEPGESAEECLLREVREETGYTLTSYTFLGVVEFRNDAWEDEDMYLYLADGYREAGESRAAADGDTVSRTDVPGCDEGDLRWIPKDEILNLNLWAGDRYFLEPMLRGETDLNMRLTYSGDTLISAERRSRCP